MATRLLNFIDNDGAIADDIAFILTLVLTTFIFLACLLLSLIKKNYTLRKRVWYFSTSCGIIILGDIAQQEKVLTVINFVVATVYFGVILSITAKEKIKDDLEEFIDREIELPIKLDKQKPMREIEEKLKVEPVQERVKNPEIDYSHVKSVIERMSSLSLSQGDRKTIKELELNVLGAENGDDRIETKRKINDGLGALLKIMAKYGA